MALYTHITSPYHNLFSNFCQFDESGYFHFVIIVHNIAINMFL